MRFRSPLPCPSAPGGVEQDEVFGIVRDQNPAGAGSQGEVRVIARPLHPQISCRSRSMARPA